MCCADTVIEPVQFFSNLRGFYIYLLVFELDLPKMNFGICGAGSYGPRTLPVVQPATS